MSVCVGFSNVSVNIVHTVDIYAVIQLFFCNVCDFYTSLYKLLYIVKVGFKVKCSFVDEYNFCDCKLAIV